MSNFVLVQDEPGRILELKHLLRDAPSELYLLQPERLAMRLHLLDKLDLIIGDLDLIIGDLDLIIGDLDLQARRVCLDPELVLRAELLKSRLEAANEALYGAVRIEIQCHGRSQTLERWINELMDAAESDKRSGLSFDLLDEIVSGILQISSPRGDGLLPSLEMTTYQPTPVRHIIDLITACGLPSRRVSSTSLPVDGHPGRIAIDLSPPKI